nr:hypothetical protein CFP56_02735 [Quercus suber]
MKRVSEVSVHMKSEHGRRGTAFAVVTHRMIVTIVSSSMLVMDHRHQHDFIDRLGVRPTCQKSSVENCLYVGYTLSTAMPPNQMRLIQTGDPPEKHGTFSRHSCDIYNLPRVEHASSHVGNLMVGGQFNHQAGYLQISRLIHEVCLCVQHSICKTFILRDAQARWQLLIGAIDSELIDIHSKRIDKF